MVLSINTEASDVESCVDQKARHSSYEDISDPWQTAQSDESPNLYGEVVLAHG